MTLGGKEGYQMRGSCSLVGCSYCYCFGMSCSYWYGGRAGGIRMGTIGNYLNIRWMSTLVVDDYGYSNMVINCYYQLFQHLCSCYSSCSSALSHYSHYIYPDSNCISNPYQYPDSAEYSYPFTLPTIPDTQPGTLLSLVTYTPYHFHYSSSLPPSQDCSGHGLLGSRLF